MAGAAPELSRITRTDPRTAPTRGCLVVLADGFAGVGGAVLPIGSGINKKPENAADVVAHLLRDGATGAEFAGPLAADGAVDETGHVALRVLQIEVFRAVAGAGEGMTQLTYVIP